MASSAVWIPPDGSRAVTTIWLDVTPCDVAPPLLPENETQAGEYGSPCTCLAGAGADGAGRGGGPFGGWGSASSRARWWLSRCRCREPRQRLWSWWPCCHREARRSGHPPWSNHVLVPVLAPTFCSGAMDGTRIAMSRKPPPITTAGP